MGISCNLTSKNKLDAELIVENINKFFQEMKIRRKKMSSIYPEIRDTIYYNTHNEDKIKYFEELVKKEIFNLEFLDTSKDLSSSAMKEANSNYKDPKLPLLCLLFLASSDKNKFLEAFKEVNEVLRDGETQFKVKNTSEAINKFDDMFQGKGWTYAISSSNRDIKNYVKFDQMKKLISYYINFLTLLPVNILGKYKEGNPMKKYFIIALNNAFNKEVQNKFINKIFNKYEGIKEINVEEFFNEHYYTLINDNQLRKDLVNDYINSLTPHDISQLIND